MLKLSEMFMAGAVLQRGMSLPVWGECSSNTVRAYLAGAEAGASVSGGRFRVNLPPLEAGGPYTLIVRAGADEIALEDIYIGEVWLAGGQSNMEMPLCCARGAREYLSNSRPSVLPRLKTISRKSYQCDTRCGFHFIPESSEVMPWVIADEYAAARFSAIGAVFGDALARELNVPIGVISCNFGGTKVQPWTSPETLETNPIFKGDIEAFEQKCAALGSEYADSERRFQETMRACLCEADDVVAGCLTDPMYTNTWAARANIDWPPEYSLGDANRPGCLWTHMLSRVFPYACRGVIWYQGESSATDEDCARFKAQTRAMIADWRRAFENENLWFLQTQLAPYDTSRRRDPCDWPLVREAQRTLCHEIHNVGMINLSGIGEKNNIHPVHKIEAGGRMAALALDSVYGARADVAAEALEACAVNGGVRVTFSRGEGLRVASPLTQLEVSLNGSEYHNASDARVETGALYIPGAAKYVRYGWSPMPECALTSSCGLPVGPFLLEVQ